MANFLDYLNGGEPEKDKETIEDVGAKDLLNRILAELISLHETVEDLTDIVAEMKESAPEKETNNYEKDDSQEQETPTGIQPLMTDAHVSVNNSNGETHTVNEKHNSKIQVSNLSEEEFSNQVGELLG